MLICTRVCFYISKGIRRIVIESIDKKYKVKETNEIRKLIT